MKKAIYLLITLLICASLCGCGAKVSENTTAQISQTATTQPTTAEPIEEATTEPTTATTSTTATVQSSTESTTKLTTVTAVFTTEKTTTKKPTSPKTKKTTTKQTTTATTTTTTTTAKSTEAAQIKCSVAIDCSSILDNMSDLKPGKEKLVPADGVILKEYKLKVKEGSTAYLALEQACEENDIPLSVEKTMYGVYISGINYLYEKDCGTQSGWLYSVNGEQPSYSAGSYVLQDGDKVVFTYTCTY